MNKPNKSLVYLFCKRCKKEFSFWYSAKTIKSRAYCSQECYLAREHKKTPIKKCSYCGKEFLAKRNPNQQCCSIPCNAKYIAGRRKGYHAAGKWKSVCLICGKETVFKYHCQAKARKYCSLDCGLRGRALGEKRANPNKLTKPFSKPCEYCNTIFEFDAKAITGRRFCSRGCQCCWMNSKRTDLIFLPWSEEEDSFLRDNYPTCAQPKLLAAQLRRAVGSLHRQAIKLGLSRTEEAIHKGYAVGGQRNKGRKRPDFAKNRFKSGRGADNPFYGKTHSPATRKILSDAMKLAQTNPEFHKKRLATLRSNGSHYECPNRYERHLNDLLEQLFPGEYKFVGDWSFVIARKNPDFININGQKKVIELFGEIYHDPESSPWPIPDERTSKGRRRLFRQYGYRTLIVWAKELGNEEALTERLKAFHEVSDC